MYVCVLQFWCFVFTIGGWLALHVFYLFYIPRILSKEKQKLNPENETFEQSLKNTDSTLDGVIAHRSNTYTFFFFVFFVCVCVC